MTALRIHLRRLVERIGILLTLAAPLLYRSPTEKVTVARKRRERQWYAEDGDRTRRLDYPLGPDAVVLDIGAYDGAWAAAVHAKFGAQIELFEPVGEFVGRIRERFAHNPRVRIHEYGLASSDRSETITLEEGGSSTVISGPEPTKRTTIELREAAAALRELGRDRYDLVKINIEGGEYELLEHLLAEDLVRRFRFVQVQFHPDAPEAERRMRAIIDGLGRTHDLQWRYPWVWESWARREDGRD